MWCIRAATVRDTRLLGGPGPFPGLPFVIRVKASLRHARRPVMAKNRYDYGKRDRDALPDDHRWYYSVQQ